MPVCGRASGVFSTFTESAGRVWLSPEGSGRPVRVAIGTGGAVLGGMVVVAAIVVVVLGLVVVADYVESSPPVATATPIAAAPMTSTATTTPITIFDLDVTYIS
jgi:hypothetical protein